MMVWEHVQYDESLGKGIHKTTREEKRVVVDGQWSIRIPAGYVYSTDPAHTGKSPATQSPRYLTAMRDDGTAAFGDNAYGANITLTVLDFVKLEVYGTDLLHDGALSAIDGEAKEFTAAFSSGKLVTAIRKRDINVQYKLGSHTKDDSMYWIGVTLFSGMYRALLSISNNAIPKEERDAFVEGWIKTILPVMTAEKGSFSGNPAIAKQYIPTFAQERTVTVGSEWQIAVPDGYLYSTDSSVISDVCLVKMLYPDKKAVYANSVEATIGLTVSKGVRISSTPMRLDQYDHQKAAVQLILNRTRMFDNRAAVHAAGATPCCLLIYQTNLFDDGGVQIRFAVITGQTLYPVTITFNLSGSPVDGALLRDMECVALLWMGTLRVVGELRPVIEGPSETKLSTATPDGKQYPHYRNLLDRTGEMQKLVGDSVVLNAGGTEFACLGLAEALEDKALAARVEAADAAGAGWKLDRVAVDMAALFRVDPGAFDPGHDRECEILAGMIGQASQFSALRSFAWTSGEYCLSRGVAPEMLTMEEIESIASFVERRKWLNYESGSHFSGLCGGPDLHVYYVPDCLSAGDRAALAADEAGRIAEPHEILCEARSLDALRGDLESLYHTMRTIHGSLSAAKDGDREPDGALADVLCAWCALAIAAKKPFFTEDGPMTCNWIRPNAPSPESGPQKTPPTSRAVGRAKRASGLPETDRKFFRIKDGVVLKFLGDKCTSADVVIPGGVRKIGDSAFSSCQTLRSVVLPEGLESVGKYAFADCQSLRSVDLPDGLASIEEMAFFNCKALESVILPEGLVSIEEAAFHTCSALESVDMPKGLDSVGISAFYNCVSLRSINLPESLTSIEDSAFAGCESLQTINLPESLNSIDSCAFSGCESLETAEFPKNLIKIGDYAFENCFNLKTIRLPAHLLEICCYAFTGCGQLQAIEVPPGVILGAHAFPWID